MIIYEKLFNRLKETEFTSYYLTKKYKVIGAATYEKLRKNEPVNISTINFFCKLLNCQPGDILEYIPEEKTPN